MSDAQTIQPEHEARQRLNGSMARWSTLAAGVLGSAASSGIVATIVFGTTLKQIAADFDWYRSQVSIALGCFYFFNGLGALLLGHLAARYGVRRPSLAYAIVFAGALLAVAYLPASLPLFLITFIVLGFAGGGCSSMPYAVGIAGWFDRGRGLALAIAVSGTGLGQIVVPTFLRWLSVRGGWRDVYVGIAAYVAVLALVALLLLYRDAPVERSKARHSQPTYLHIYRASAEVRAIALSIFLFSIASLGSSVSLPSIMSDRGFGGRDIAAVLTAFGAATWAAKLATGMLLDRIHVRIVTSVIFGAVTAAALLLITAHSLVLCYVIGCLLGVGVGAEADIMSFAASRYQPPSRVAKAMGAIWVLMSWGAGLGVMLGSTAFDFSGGYGAALGFYAACAAAAAVIVLRRLGPYRDHLPCAEEEGTAS